MRATCVLSSESCYTDALHCAHHMRHHRSAGLPSHQSQRLQLITKSCWFYLHGCLYLQTHPNSSMTSLTHGCCGPLRIKFHCVHPPHPESSFQPTFPSLSAQVAPTSSLSPVLSKRTVLTSSTRSHWTSRLWSTVYIVTAQFWFLTPIL